MTTTASQSPTVLLALIFVIVSFLQQQQLVLASTPPPPLTTTPSSNSSPVIPAPSVFTRISNFFHQRQQARAAIKRERRLVDYFQACNQGSVDRVSHFLYPYNPRDAPIDIDTADSTANSASTCLMKAALARQYDLISYLLLRGASLTQLDHYDRNVLQLVIGEKEASAPIAAMFLKHARNTLSPSDLYSLVNNHGIIDTTATSNITSTPVIFLAILSLREDILKLLVSHNLPTNLTLSQYPLSDGKSALMVAIQSGTIFMMQLLLKKATSDLNHMDLLKNTPLALACLQPYERLETLLKYDDGLINPNLLNMQGLSPLFICGVSSPTKFSLLFRHFQNRLDISLRDNRGKSIIQHAVELNHLNAFECIVKRARKQAKLSSIIGQEIPNSGGNILHLASHLSWTDNKDMVEYMMENLILATSAHKNRLSHIVNKVDNEGMTPLMRAIYATANPNNEAVIDILINKGRADLKVRNNDGKTAADLAFEKGRINLGEELYCRMHNIKRLEEEEKECCVCFGEFCCDNPRVKPYLCDHSVDGNCFKRMETAAAIAAGWGRNPGSKCPQCRAIKRKTRVTQVPR